MKQYLALMLALLLSGCFGMATKGYDVATDQRSVGKQAGDAEIWGQIKKDLLQSSVNGTDQISLFCRNGIVVLAGVVANGSQAGTETVRIAHQVQGVKKVETYFLPSQQHLKNKVFFSIKYIINPI